MTALLIFIAGCGGASLIALLAWTFASSVRDLREEDAMLAAFAEERQTEASR
jgi:hypothetical protein